ncbi:SDR family NAD(P)-dependent oxidoreductase [Nocardia cyriacigeorgica]|uniref:SDR family NAD(P)-dependent oxidoreductase n=1 Tax=Nocardia cyriacigeorgica TaxID=135487 RepID=UPI001895D384|nr:SDR family oxidoreductase [Nocardia cyriacigeorgica]MBF6455336.1 SDR family oxidoreductase [Nocardia cyriacigeorgica]MBF6480544.1 SDR family oxidoreductase [Nocardia cyriacigeorgica]MBF6553922.1 SDR family oxidoreductase [Nocardia cyriacigeorgica]
MGNLDNKVAIVSGSGRGIGREIALKFAAQGARVVVNDLDAEPAKETVAAIEAAGGQAVAVPGSVTDEDFAQRFVATAVDTYGGLDIIVNNAGQSNYSAAKAGVLGLTKTLAKEWGRYNVTVNAVAFGLIKTRLTEAPADGSSTIDVQGRELKVGVNPDLLAAMEHSIPLGRAGTPVEAAGAVYLLCTPESDYISGQTLVCGGGFNV